MNKSILLYLIEFLHQTTTARAYQAQQSGLYLIEFLHQTTTFGYRYKNRICCILLNFYIKPQLKQDDIQRRASCILLNFYIKPQPVQREIVHIERCILLNFYIKPQRGVSNGDKTESCILLNFYIKPQPRAVFALFLWLLCPVSRLKKTGLNSAEVDLMSFFVFQRTNIAKYLRKTPTAGVYPVLPVRFSPRNSEYRRTVCPLRPGCSYIPMAASNALPD